MNRGLGQHFHQAISQIAHIRIDIVAGKYPRELTQGNGSSACTQERADASGLIDHRLRLAILLGCIGQLFTGATGKESTGSSRIDQGAGSHPGYRSPTTGHLADPGIPKHRILVDQGRGSLMNIST